MRNNYWSCSKFADWLRGTAKPLAGTADEWNDWNANTQGHNPARFWLAEEGLDYVQKAVYFVPDLLYSIKYYVNNRWVTRTHSLTAHPRDIKPGAWRDVGDRFLPCLFNELVDFVEVELAWWHVVWDDAAAKQFASPWYARGWFRWRTWRNPACGTANLNWQRKLVYDDEWMDKTDANYGLPTPQAVKAQEIFDLYYWWTQTRPARPDPYEASGWLAYCEASTAANGGKFNFDGPKDPELRKASDKAHKLLQKMEADYEQEDEDMMIRLIRVRHGLWT